GPHQLLVQALVVQLRVTLQAIDHFDVEIAAVAKRLPDYALFAALPGAGSILAPRLLVAFGEQRQRYACAAQLQQYAGVAPVLERSGNKCWVHWRLACPTFLRQTFVEWAGSTLPRSFGASGYYHRQRPSAAHTRPPCAPCPTSGFAFCTLLADPHPLRRDRLSACPQAP